MLAARLVPGVRNPIAGSASQVRAGDILWDSPTRMPCLVALGITRLAIFFLACRVSHQGRSYFPCLSCLPFGSTAWVPLPDWPDPCWSGWARAFGSAAFAPGVSLAKDRHIVGEPMRAFEAGQELLCLDAWGPVLRACLLARCDRAIPTSRPGARPWDRVALHAAQPVLNI